MKILFFSLNAAIWVHALPENRLAVELSNAGHEITYVTCDRGLKGHCTSMSGCGYQPDLPDYRKEEVCRLCVSNAAVLATGNGGQHLTLAAHLAADDETVIDEFVAEVPRDGYLDARWKGINVGRIAAYEVFLQFKKMSPILSPDEWSYYEIYLRNTLRAGLAFERIFDFIKPDVVFFYSPQYATNGVCAEIAARRGATTYFVEGSSNNAERYKALRVWDWSKNGLMNPALLHWDKAKARVTSEDVKRVTKHFDELFAATSFAVYSSPRQSEFSARNYFKIPEGAKFLLATLSSFDEAYAAVVIGKFPESKLKSAVFKDQFEWIERTFDYLDGRDDVRLVVRVHPRDYPNKRENVQSEQAMRWEILLAKRPSNVIVNTPQEQIALYNILEEIDVLLTGWSATGVEALAYGVPVVTYDEGLPSYPGEIHLTGRYVQEYFANIDRALSLGRDVTRSVGAFKWLAASFSLGTIRIEEETLLERLLGRLKAHPRLPPGLRQTTEGVLMRFQARRAMPHRGDAARFRALVETRAPDLIEVAVQQRMALDPARQARDIVQQLNRWKFDSGR